MTDTNTISSSPLLDLLFENAGAGLCLVAPDGTIVRASAEWLRTTGFTRDVIGEDIVDLFPETRGMALGIHARARAGHHVEVPRHAQLVNGRETWWEGSIDPVPMEGGTGLLITAREVTMQPRRSAEPERDAHESRLDATRLQALISALPVGVIVADAAGNFTLTNAAARELVGGITGTASGPTACYTLHRPEGGPFPPSELPLVRALRGEATRSVEVIARRAGATDRVLLSASVPVRGEDGAVTGAIAVLQDITERKLQEAALRESEERFRVLAETMPQIVCVLATDGTVEYVNRTWTEFSGLDAAASARAGWEDVFHPDDVNAARACRRHVVERLEPRDVELRYRAADGTYRWFLSRLAPMVEGGRVVRLVGAGMEIEGRKRAEEALARSDAAFEHAGKLARFGAWSVEFEDRRGTVRAVYWSDEVYRIFGYAPREVEVSVDLWDRHIHPDDRGRAHEAIDRAVESAGSYSLVHRIVWRDGTERVVAAHGEVQRDSASGSPVAMIGAVQDVTEQHRMEQQLREADRRKDEFLGMLSHELRNPLAPIRNASYILGHADPASDAARRAREVIERQTEHITRLVDDLLDVTRIARGKIELRRSTVDLREVVLRAAEDFRLVMEDKGIAFEAALPRARLPAEVDGVRVTQVVGNLLHNAAKFSQRGDAVTLSLALDEGDAVIRVRDTGAGIDPVLLPAVFDPFVQGERTLARTEGGLGLGLALVKGITEMHGGTVAATSAGCGHGSEFTVRVPVRGGGARQVGSAPGASSPKATAAKRVLVVDDNHDAADTLVDLVRMLGHEAEVAYDGPGALRAARESLPEVVLCDIGLPGMSGYEVARELRRLSQHHARILAVTGYAQPEDVAQAIEAGFDGHVAKPPDPAQLESLLGE